MLSMTYICTWLFERKIDLISLLRKMQILEPLQFRFSVFYHFTVVNKV